MRPSPPSRFVGFDGLRGVAILLVILWHGAVMVGFPVAAMGVFRPLVMTGWAGVDLFFALSGFLITSLILREEQTGRFDLARFYGRRALRILPVFYAVFLLITYGLDRFPIFTTIRAGEVATTGSPLGLVPYATFWGNYFSGYPLAIVGRGFTDPGHAYLVFWSLCVEEHFYLLWPLFLVLVKGWRARVIGAALVCLGMGLFRHLADARGWDPPNVIHSVSHYRMDSILWGALGALVHDRLPMRARLRRTLLVALISTTVALVLAGEMSVIPKGTALGMSLGFSLLAVTSTMLLLELAAAPTTLLARALEWRPLRLVGQVSYGMYLVHFPMIDLGRSLFFAVPRPPTLTNLWLSFALFALLSFGAASVLYWVVERPFLRLKDRLR